MSSGIRPPRNNRISIIFYSFYKNLLWIHQSLPLPCTKQGDLQAQCPCAILLSLCSAVNGSLHHRTGPYCPHSHSQNSTTHLEKAKWSFSVPHPEAIWHHRVRIYLNGSGHGPCKIFCLRQQPTSAAAGETLNGQLCNNLSMGEYALLFRKVGAVYALKHENHFKFSCI